MIGRQVMFERRTCAVYGFSVASVSLVSGVITDEWTEWEVFRGEYDRVEVFQVLLSDGALVEARRHELNFFAWQ